MFIQNAWYIAAWAHEVRDKPLARRICNQPLVLFRDARGQAAALQDRCSHRGTPLRFGDVVEEGLQCGYHGLVFDATGACVKIPGQAKVPARARVKSYPLVEKDEFLWVWMGDEPADPTKIIDYPWHNDHAKWPHKHEVYHVKGSYMLLVDNLMDMTHLGYVHKSTIGGNPKLHVEAKTTVTPTDDGLHFIRWMLDCPPPPTYSKAQPRLGSRVDRWQEFQYIAPGNVLQWSGAIDTGRGAQQNRDQDGSFSLRLFHGLTPETETTCFYFWSTANGYRQDEPEATEQLFQEIGRAFQEDKAIVEAQQAMLTETGESDLVDIVSDAARVHMRRVVQRALASERPIAAAPAP